WLDQEHNLALGHRRLAILDLSPAGHQPMQSACERYVIAFNGEIYNHLELRGQLEAADRAPAWRSHSDTETLLAGFAAWGVERTLKA
ncbi:asparagine synthetase B, partial [Pseudomonas sp. MOB-449]|nr:asparagine synthetase B [Pseudomonas sp. MOB-449]